MNTDWIFLIGLVAAIFPRKGNATIMCSKCRSDTYPACEIKPPAPTSCVSSGSGIPESCSIVRIYSKVTGVLDQFIRSCANTEVNKCFDSQPGFETCADICYTDGCNSAPPPILSTANHFALLVSLCSFLFCTRVLLLNY